MEVYKCHLNDGEWVIRRYYGENAFEGVGVANGPVEATSICEGMNAALQLVLWSEGGDDPDALHAAVNQAKHAVRPLQIPTCHLCGETEVEADLDACIACNKWVCPECAFEVESDDGDPVGCVCGECRESSDVERE